METQKGKKVVTKNFTVKEKDHMVINETNQDAESFSKSDSLYDKVFPQDKSAD